MIAACNHEAESKIKGQIIHWMLSYGKPHGLEWLAKHWLHIAKLAKGYKNIKPHSKYSIYLQ